MAFGLPETEYEPLSASSESKASALTEVLQLLVAHDNYLQVQDTSKSASPVIQGRRSANASMEKLITELLVGKPVDEALAATLAPRLHTLVEWAQTNPELVPNREFAVELKAKVNFASQVEAFKPVNPRLSTLAR